MKCKLSNILRQFYWKNSIIINFIIIIIVVVVIDFEVKYNQLF